MKEILNTIETQELSELAQELIKTIPDYFWHAPASSSGKYHPKYALGEGGLYRHTLAAARILNHILNLEAYRDKYNAKDRDIMRIAIMMHDTRKSGSQEDYTRNPNTRFDHPLLAANVIRQFFCKGHDDKALEKIAACIASHMGQWQTSNYSDVTLPKPINHMQELVHVADYLASRKDLEVLF